MREFAYLYEQKPMIMNSQGVRLVMKEYDFDETGMINIDILTRN